MKKIEKNRPRVVILGRKLERFKDDIAASAGNVVTIDATRDAEWHSLDWSEIDIIVSAGDHGSPSNVHHLVVGFEGRSGGFQTDVNEMRIENLVGNMGVFQSPAEQLIRAIIRSGESPGGIELDLPDVVTSPIISSSGWAVAALYTMNKEVGRILSVPESADVRQWFRAFADYLHNVDPLAVPRRVTTLSTSEMWYSPREKKARDQLAATSDERDRLEKKMQDLTSELEVATAEADKRERKVLWGEGASLERAVGVLLEDLGFRVQYNETHTDTGPVEVEDLYITPSDGSGRVAIVKVRAYTESVDGTDLQKLNKFTSRFAAENGREAELSMLVVNPYRKVDPSLRTTNHDQQLHDQAVLTNAKVVKTTDLYRIWRDHSLGLLDGVASQEKLFASELGVWEY